ncbi:hypothetical protein OQA88_11019 [Cercophora sp. LCS_1]
MGLELAKYHTSEEAMRQAILEGCHLCSLLNNYIPAGLGRLGLDQDLASFGPKLELWEGDEKEMELWQRDEMQLSISTASDASFNQGKKWISECFSTHPSCNYSDMISKIGKPTRLLDVGNAEIRLRCTEELLPRLGANGLEYLTLSHCWGNASILKLTQGNMERLRQSIDFQDLPLTFQHAVTTTRRLGFQYVWIDSLCIIQDSASDWEQESAMMGDIYRGGSCNISAVAATDSNAGFFIARNPLFYIPCRLGAMEKLSPVAKSQPTPSNTTGRLSTRGWVMQERAMSPRTLHFGPTGLAWECLSQRMNEKQSLSGIRPKAEFSLLEISSLPPLNLANPDKLTRTFYDAWVKLLTSYSRCDLTVLGDRLVAFSAIVAEASRRTGLTPIAGLWKELLPADLLWYRDASSPPLGSPQSYQAPSWSWGAVASGIQSAYAELLRSGATLEFKTTVSNPSASAKPNGQVITGHIRLTGPSRRFNWAGGSETEEPRKNCRLDCLQMNELDDLYLLLVVRGRGASLHLVNDRIEQLVEDKGLVLQPVNGTPGSFRRIGSFQQSYIGDISRAVFADNIPCEIRDFLVV